MARDLTDLQRNASLGSGPQHSRQWDAAFQKLEALKDLQADWDHDGAETPKADLIVAARRLLFDLRGADKKAPSRVSASSEGTIVLEWQEPGVYEEYEIVEPDTAERMEMIAGRPATHEDVRF